MRIIFIKGCVFNRRHRPIGSITTVTQTIGNELILAGKAKSYSGAYPPTEKAQTDFFKPKDIEEHGKEHGEDRG